MADEAGEKTEQATERRIEQSRTQGRVASSRELIAAVSMAAGVVGGGLAAPGLLQTLVNVGRMSLDRATTGVLSVEDVPTLAQGILLAAAPGVLGFIVPAAGASLVTGLLLTRFNVSTEALEPKFERLDPFTNFSSQFMSSTPWVGLARSLAIGAVVVWSVYSSLAGELLVLPAASAWSAPTQLAFMGRMARTVFERAIPVTLLVGMADYAWQNWKSSRDMMMTRQEVKEEHKDTDGDPVMKQRRRQRARQIAANRQVRDVPRADVVVTNPTHYAVALRYRKEENAAPMILAIGVDLVALRIRAAAGRNDVPVVENQPLARALAARGRVGKPVPRDLYGPVAKVLAAIYRRRK